MKKQTVDNIGQMVLCICALSMKMTGLYIRFMQASGKAAPHSITSHKDEYQTLWI